MMSREILLSAVKLMFALLGCGFLLVLFISLSGPSRVTTAEAAFDSVQIGQTTLRRVDQKRVWATRLSPAQRTQATQLDVAVHKPLSGCDASVIVCGVSVETNRDGIEIIFSEQAPPQVPKELPWFGGLVDPNNGNVYDRLGRAYRLPDRPEYPSLRIAISIGNSNAVD